MKIKTGIGQDSHSFEKDKIKKLVLAGVEFENHEGLKGNSDADVVLHSITNAISSITGRNIIGKVADDMCKKGIYDSTKYLQEAFNDLNLQEWEIQNIAISIECSTPKISPKIEKMKNNIAKILNITNKDVGITATTGEYLTAFGKKQGIQCFSIITTIKK